MHARMDAMHHARTPPARGRGGARTGLAHATPCTTASADHAHMHVRRRAVTRFRHAAGPISRAGQIGRPGRPILGWRHTATPASRSETGRGVELLTFVDAFLRPWGLGPSRAVFARLVKHGNASETEPVAGARRSVARPAGFHWRPASGHLPFGRLAMFPAMVLLLPRWFHRLSEDRRWRRVSGASGDRWSAPTARG
jgi:hypothetical protein